MSTPSFPTDLATVLTSGYNVREPGLIGWWPMNTVPEYPDGASPTLLMSTFVASILPLTTANLLVSYPGGGIVRFTEANTNAGNIYLNTTYTAPKTVRFKIRASRNVNGLLYRETIGGTNYDKTFNVTTDWNIVDLYTNSGSVTAATILMQSMTNASSDWMEMQFLYVGDGTYATPSYDRSGNGLDCLIFGSTRVAGISGNGLSRDGVNDYERTSAVLATVPDVWHYHESFPFGHAQLASNQTFLNYRLAGSVASLQIFRQPSTDTLSIQYWNGSVSYISFTSYFTGYSSLRIEIDITINWTTGLISLYRNGIFISSQAMSNAIKPSPGYYMYFGTYQNQYNYCAGIVDERRLYNYALDPSRIYKLYASPSNYEALPSQPLSDGYGDSPQDNILRSSMSTGPVKSRLRSTVAPRIIQTQYYLSVNQKQILEQFYASLGGVNPFYWTTPDTGETLTVTFDGRPTYAIEGLGFRARFPLRVVA